MNIDSIKARMDELDRMIYDGEGMPFGDRRDSLEAEYDELLELLSDLKPIAV